MCFLCRRGLDGFLAGMLKGLKTCAVALGFNVPATQESELGYLGAIITFLRGLPKDRMHMMLVRQGLMN